MSAAGLLAPAPAPAAAPPAPEYYPEDDEELESAEDDERSCRGRESDEGEVRAAIGARGLWGRGQRSPELSRARASCSVSQILSGCHPSECTWVGVMPSFSPQNAYRPGST